MMENEASAVESNGQEIQSSVPEPRPEDTATTKAELIERKIKEEHGKNERPSKRPRSDDRDVSEDTNGRRKGIAMIKPEFVSPFPRCLSLTGVDFGCLNPMGTRRVEQ